MRIAGVDLPDDKKIDFALTRLYGVGWPRAQKILKDVAISPAKKTRDLSEAEVGKLTKALESYQIEGNLRRGVLQNIGRLKDIGSYRGLRHSRNLPVRGQRTRTNARSKRGKRKTVGAFKKEILSKQLTRGGAGEAATTK